MKKAGPTNARSAGWLVHESDASICVCPHVTDDGDGDGEVQIPRDWVSRIVDLVEAKRGKR